MRNISGKKIVRKTAMELRPQRLADLRRQSRRAVDAADIPEVPLAGAGESHRIRKCSITLRLDEDVIAYFRAQGTGYQTRINRVLRAAIHPGDNLSDQLRSTASLLEQLAQRVK